MDSTNSRDSKKLSESLLINQKVIPYLQNLGYQYLDNEFPIIIGNTKERADLIVYINKDKTEPYIVAEVKQKLPNEVTLLDPLVQKSFTLAVALGKSVRYLLITDGYKYHWFERSDKGSSLTQLSNPPEIVQEYNRPPLIKSLIPITDPDQFLRVMESAIQALRREGMASGLRIGIELNRILIAKLHDEQVILSGGDSNFSSRQVSAEQIALKVEQLYKAALAQLDGISTNEGLWFLSPQALLTVVKILEPYSFSSVTPSILGRFFWQAFPNFTKLEERINTTPVPLAELIVQLVQPQRNDLIIDPACGTGLFLIEATKYIEAANIADTLSVSESNRPNYKHNVVGIERNAEVAELAITNLVLNGISPAQIIRANALDKNEIERSGIKMGTYNIVLFDPPIGTAIPRDEQILYQYQIAQQSGKITFEALFMELAIELACTGGVIAILVPDSLLTLPAYTNIRTLILHKTTPKAIISLPSEAFAPVGHSGKASILLLEKAAANSTPNNSVLVAEVQSVGYDKFGQTTEESDLPYLIEIVKTFFQTGQVKVNKEDSKLKVWSVALSEISNKRLDTTQLNPISRDLIALGNSKYPLVQLNKVVDIISGRNFKKYAEKSNHTALVLQAGSIRDLILDLSTTPYISLEDYDNAKRVQVSKGDVLVTTTGLYLGRATAIDNLSDLAVASGAVTILRPLARSEIDPFFLAAVISSNIGKKQIARRAITTAQPYIRRTDLGTILIPMPSLVEQKEIAEHIRHLLTESKELASRAYELETTAKQLVVNELLEDGNNA